MDFAGFEKFLKESRRSPSAVSRCLKYVTAFDKYLADIGFSGGLEVAGPSELQGYVASIESNQGSSAKSHLWAIRYYYQFTTNPEMERLTAAFREERIERKPLPINKFRGIDAKTMDALANLGIMNTQQMLRSGNTAAKRRQLASSAAVPEEIILELVKLSDLSRIPGIKGIRARLYYDAGVDTVRYLASFEPASLLIILKDHVQVSGFAGIAPFPAEVHYAIDTAKKLPDIIEF